MTTADSPVVEDVEMAAPADEKVGVNVGVKQNNHDMAREENGSHTGIVYWKTFSSMGSSLKLPRKPQ